MSSSLYTVVMDELIEAKVLDIPFTEKNFIDILFYVLEMDFRDFLRSKHKRARELRAYLIRVDREMDRRMNRETRRWNTALACLRQMSIPLSVMLLMFSALRSPVAFLHPLSMIDPLPSRSNPFVGDPSRPECELLDVDAFLNRLLLSKDFKAQEETTRRIIESGHVLEAISLLFKNGLLPSRETIQKRLPPFIDKLFSFLPCTVDWSFNGESIITKQIDLVRLSSDINQGSGTIYKIPSFQMLMALTLWILCCGWQGMVRTHKGTARHFEGSKDITQDTTKVISKRCFLTSFAFQTLLSLVPPVILVAYSLVDPLRVTSFAGEILYLVTGFATLGLFIVGEYYRRLETGQVRTSTALTRLMSVCIFSFLVIVARSHCSALVLTMNLKSVIDCHPTCNPTQRKHENGRWTSCLPVIAVMVMLTLGSSLSDDADWYGKISATVMSFVEIMVPSFTSLIVCPFVVGRLETQRKENRGLVVRNPMEYLQENAPLLTLSMIYPKIVSSLTNHSETSVVSLVPSIVFFFYKMADISDLSASSGGRGEWRSLVLICTACTLLGLGVCYWQ